MYREVSDRGSSKGHSEGRKYQRRRNSTTQLSPAQAAEQRLAKSLVGCLGDTGGRFKENGLVKKVYSMILFLHLCFVDTNKILLQTITVVIEGSDHHLIAYYTQEDVRLGKLLPLSSREDINTLEIPPELLESTKFRVPPIVEQRLDGRPRYLSVIDIRYSHYLD